MKFTAGHEAELVVSTPEILAGVAMVQVERLGTISGDVHDPSWWEELAREADDLATSARAVALSLRVQGA